ncbi:MAG TPA: hypothetical protein VHZ76_07185 [Gammaproteobacteria bacterium]|jgi:hypothetical protein|nr:hypothetical protein [Gammaproteobacteria bacterium]
MANTRELTLEEILAQLVTDEFAPDDAELAQQRYQALPKTCDFIFTALPVTETEILPQLRDVIVSDAAFILTTRDKLFFYKTENSTCLLSLVFRKEIDELIIALDLERKIKKTLMHNESVQCLISGLSYAQLKKIMYCTKRVDIVMQTHLAQFESVRKNKPIKDLVDKKLKFLETFYVGKNKNRKKVFNENKSKVSKNIETFFSKKIVEINQKNELMRTNEVIIEESIEEKIIAAYHALVDARNKIGLERFINAKERFTLLVSEMTQQYQTSQDLQSGDSFLVSEIAQQGQASQALQSHSSFITNELRDWYVQLNKAHILLNDARLVSEVAIMRDIRLVYNPALLNDKTFYLENYPVNFALTELLWYLSDRLSAFQANNNPQAMLTPEEAALKEFTQIDSKITLGEYRLDVINKLKKLVNEGNLSTAALNLVPRLYVKLIQNFIVNIIQNRRRNDPPLVTRGGNEIKLFNFLKPPAELYADRSEEVQNYVPEFSPTITSRVPNGFKELLTVIQEYIDREQKQININEYTTWKNCLFEITQLDMKKISESKNLMAQIVYRFIAKVLHPVVVTFDNTLAEEIKRGLYTAERIPTLITQLRDAELSIDDYEKLEEISKLTVMVLLRKIALPHSNTGSVRLFDKTKPASFKKIKDIFYKINSSEELFTFDRYQSGDELKKGWITTARNWQSCLEIIRNIAIEAERKFIFSSEKREIYAMINQYNPYYPGRYPTLAGVKQIIGDIEMDIQAPGVQYVSSVLSW